MGYAKQSLQGSHVEFSVPQLLHNPDSFRMCKYTKQRRQLASGKGSIRHNGRRLPPIFLESRSYRSESL